MNIAIIKDGKCVNIALFDSLATAQSFLAAGVYDADAVVELPDGYGIGDSYDGEKWTKAPQPEPEPTPEPEQEPTTDEILLDLDYRVTCLELGL